MPNRDKTKHAAYCREWKKRNYERHLATQRAYRAAHREHLNALRLKSYHADPERHEKLKEKYRIYQRKLRLAMLKAYGEKCECCGETREAFLTIDHIYGRETREHREWGPQFYAMLRRNGWPKDKYRLLCMNCNFARGHRGICPHEIERQQEENLRELWQGQLAS